MKIQTTPSSMPADTIVRVERFEFLLQTEESGAARWHIVQGSGGLVGAACAHVNPWHVVQAIREKLLVRVRHMLAQEGRLLVLVDPELPVSERVISIEATAVVAARAILRPSC